jgi:hypothetical protein
MLWMCPREPRDCGIVSLYLMSDNAQIFILVTLHKDYS